jgi:hypothetical protein
MPTIAIIDDRHDLRSSLSRNMSLYVPAHWAVVDSPPLESIDEYPSWITEHEVSTFVVDEKLHEQARDAEGHAAYNGHDVVDYLRPRFPSLPIFVVTSYPEESDLQDRLGKVEGIIPRNRFTDRASDFVDRLVRSGQKYAEEHQAELLELAERTARIATGGSTHEDIERVRVLQEKLGLPFSAIEVETRSEWISEMTERLDELEKLREEIADFIRKNER